jgi:hypothetical protein
MTAGSGTTYIVLRPAFPLAVQAGTHLAKIINSALDRFFAKVRQGDDGCWEWTGGVSARHTAYMREYRTRS